ncbi:MAG: hypothetical protein ABSC89_10535 [Verrucomicrobiota bacterium]
MSALSIGLLAFAGVARAQCDLYPIALSVQTLANAQPGTVITNIFNGSQPGNFGWLTWAGSPKELALVYSLTPPGNSFTYVDPFNSGNNQVQAGSWVQGKPGVSNSESVRDALDNLESMVITVPVWDQAQSQGNNTLYHIVGFADVQIISYQLPSQNVISVLFLGFTNCGGPVD